MARRRRHRILRVVGWILGGVVGLVVLAIATGLIALHTDWGREQVRRIAERELNNLVDGHVVVGKITGSVLSQFEVHGLTLDDPRGTRVISVGTFGLEWDPLALLKKHFHARKIEVVGPIVEGARADDGSLNLAHLLKPKAPSPDTGPTPWVIAVDKLVIRDGFVTLPLGAEPMTLARLDVDAAAQIAADSRAATLSMLHADWIERGLPLDVRGRVLSTSVLDMISAVEAHAGGSRVSVPFALFDPKSGAASAIVDGAVREAELFHFWPHGMAVGDATFGGAVARAGADAPLQGNLHATALHGQLWSSVVADLGKKAVRGELRVRGVRAPGPTPATADVDATFDLAGASVETAQGTLALTARGEVRGRKIEHLKLDATLGGGVARTDLTVNADAGNARLHADLRLGKPLTIDAARLQAQVADLGVVAPGLRGAVTADLTASGTLPDLRARGRVDVRALAAGSARVATARLDVDAAKKGNDLSGNVKLDAGGVVVAAQPLGRVRVNATGGGNHVAVDVAVGGKGVPYAGKIAAKVTLEPTATRIDLGELALTARGLALNGHGGKIILHKSGAIEADELSLSSAAGSIEVTGHLASPHPPVDRRAQGSELHLHVSGLDLARLRAAFAPGMAPVEGKISLDLHGVRDGSKLGLEGEYSATDVVAASKVPPLDALGRINLGDGKLFATGHVRERITGGVVDYSIEADVPREVLDARSWKKVDLDEALRGATIQLRQLDVGTMAGLAHLRGYKGRVDGTIRVQPGTRSLDLALQGRDLEVPGLNQGGFAMNGTWSHTGLDVGVDLSLAESRVLTVTGKVPVGLHALVDKLADLRNAPITIHAESHGLELAKLRPALASTKVRLAGTANLDADVTGTVAAPAAKMKLTIADARVAKVGFQSFAADASLDSAHVVAHVTAQQAGGGSLAADAKIDRSDANATNADVKARGFDLGFLPALARSRTDTLAGAGGKLDADLHIALGADGRTATGTATLKDGSFYVPSSGLVDKIQLTAKLEDGKLTVANLSGRAGDGSVSGSLQAALDGLVPKSFGMDVQVVRFPVLAGPMVIAVSTTGKVEGKMAPGAMDLTVTLHDTNVRVPSSNRPGGKLQSTGALQDVVFVDAPDLMQRTAITALGGDPDALESGGSNMTVKLVADGGIAVSGQEIELEVNPNLTVYMRNGLTSIGGGVEATHGFFQLFGRRWDINTANLSFDDSDTQVNPQVDIELQHDFTTTTVYISVTGTVQQPKLGLRAEPGSYEQGQILSWVLGGSPDDPAGDKTSLSSKAAGAASSVLLGQIQSQLRSALPVDVLSVQIGEGADQATTRVEVGKWLTDDLFLGYRGRVNAPDNQNVNEADVEWRLGKRWLLDAFFGDRGVGSADILWSKRY